MYLYGLLGGLYPLVLLLYNIKNVTSCAIVVRVTFFCDATTVGCKSYSRTVLAIFPNSSVTTEKETRFFPFCIYSGNDMCHVSDHRLPLNIQLLVFKIQDKLLSRTETLCRGCNQVFSRIIHLGKLLWLISLKECKKIRSGSISCKECNFPTFFFYFQTGTDC